MHDELDKRDDMESVIEDSSTKLFTFLGRPILDDVRAILYLCDYNHTNNTIRVTSELHYYRPFDALEAYANIPNPESMMASGRTKEEFERELMQLHSNLRDEKWVKELADYL